MNRLYNYILAHILILSWLVLTAAGCANPGIDQNGGTGGDVFAIYLLVDKTAGEPPYDLDKFKLQDKPWLTIKDIDFYDFSAHCIYLKKDRSSLFAGTIPMSLTYPFVVVANGERCYLGHFVSPVSSYAPMTPVVIMMDSVFGLYPEDVMAIQAGFFGSVPVDLRNDERIRGALFRSGKLQEGLSVVLDDVKIVGRKGDTVVLDYAFTIANGGDTALYVPDPEKMGSGFFHYYTGGIVLSPKDGFGPSIGASLRTVTAPEPYDSWDIAWFTRIDSYESISRTVTLDGYPNIPPGTYTCRFAYSGPLNIEKGERILPDGRIWLGEVKSSTIEITLKD